jgi:hypothetical protein
VSAPNPGTSTNQDPTRPRTPVNPGLPTSTAAVLGPVHGDWVVTGRRTAPPRQLNQGGANVSLSYSHKNVDYGATLRCVRLATVYQLNAEESHARQYNAFYPHRRNQGRFSLTLACLGWREYGEAMAWFTHFARQSLAMSVVDPAMYIDVALPARDFSRKGIPVSGIGFGDHTASMVFSPTIEFVAARDNYDPSQANAQTKINKFASRVDQDGIDGFAVKFFYPWSAVMTPGSLAENLYGPTGEVPPLTSTDAQQVVNGPIWGEDRLGHLGVPHGF